MTEKQSYGNKTAEKIKNTINSMFTSYIVVDLLQKDETTFITVSETELNKQLLEGKIISLVKGSGSLEENLYFENQYSVEFKFFEYQNVESKYKQRFKEINASLLGVVLGCTMEYQNKKIETKYER
jgi:hypothetical protein